MRALTDIFIKKPVLAIVVNLVILVVGLRSIGGLPVRQYPRLESSSVIITTVYVGASADTVRGFITTPIERVVSAIDGIDYIESASTAGVSTVTVHLRLNHNSNDALAEISARLNQVRSQLPAEAESPSIDIQRTDKPYATFYLSFTSPVHTLTQINDLLVRRVQPELQAIPGVQRCLVEGPREPAMRVWLNAARMDALSVTPADVWKALRDNNYLAAIGKVQGRDVQVDLLTDTDLRTVEDFQRLIVREEAGSIVRLSDVARVELGSEEATGQAGFNGVPAMYLSVWPLPSANELDVAKLLKAKVDEVRTQLPSGIDMKIAYDGTYYMEHAIQEIVKTLGETILIVSVVVFLFMGSIRTVLVPLIAMPISLVGAFLAMKLFGFSINLLTILAVVLAVGLVVDDAIVIVENVERHVREGKSRLDAALLGARELFAPVISMTITLAAVYAPIGFQGGLTGMLFREFAFTLAAAVVISGVVALTLSPVMSAALVPPGGKEPYLTRVINRFFDALRSFYERVLRGTIGARWAVASATLLFAVAAVPMYLFSQKELAPTEDEGIVFAFVQGAPDATLESSVRGFEGIARAYMSTPETKFFFQVLMSPNTGFGGIQVRDWGERRRSTHEIQPEIFMKLLGVQSMRSVAILPPPLPGAGQFDVELVVTSTQNEALMAEHAGALIGAAYGSKKFMYAETDLKLDLPQTRLVIDRQKVADMGLDLASVGQELSVLLAGAYVNRFSLDGRSYKVIPQLEPDARTTAEQLLQLKVRTSDGGLVMVGSFAKLQPEAAPRALNRFQQRNSFKIQGLVTPGSTKEEALSALEDAARKILPPGYAIDYAGESRQIRKEGSSLAVTLGFALILIYLVLAAQFGSFRDPFIVLGGSVPLALAGALVFTFLGFTTINIYSQVGLITLVGLVAKNGILIVEFANHLQEQGLSKIDAACQSAATRLRPILMTSAATVLGHFPLVLVSGAGAEARNSIGIVLVAGMAISTIFTLFVVPALYVIVAASHAKAPVSGGVIAPRAADTPEPPIAVTRAATS